MPNGKVPFNRRVELVGSTTATKLVAPSSAVPFGAVNAVEVTALL